MRTKNRWVNVLFLFPAVFAFLMVIVVPFFVGIYLSMTNWDGVNPNVIFTGLQNYTTIFQAPEFLYSFLATTAFTAINVALVNAVAFGLALLVTSRVRGRNVYRAAFFVPNLIGGIVLGYIWQFIFNNVLPAMGRSLGLGFLQTSLIAKANLVVLGISLVNTWQYAGYIMMIYVAGIQAIPASLMEAAETDGANYPTRLVRILMPMMASAFTICLFLTLVNSFKQFDVNVSLTNGGPATIFMMKAINSSEFLALNIYNTAFARSKLAQGQAKAVLFFVVLVVVSLIQVWVNKRKEVEM
ncbi:MAG: sugar ABC transporter permease [Oscillospiraceae bacterium]|nr:sugar ABC transporter permease [Oscillospiraceae bacterium]